MLSYITLLEAVNTLLSVIGQAPINSLTGNATADVVTAQNIINTESRFLQARGWHWNTERAVTLNPSVPDGYIDLAPSIINVDTTYGYPDIVQRGSRLFNKDTNTYVFDRAITVDYVRYLEFDELPEPARHYLTIRAARIFQDRVLGAETLHKFQQTDEVLALARLRQYEAQSGDYNFFNNEYSRYSLQRGRRVR